MDGRNADRLGKSLIDDMSMLEITDEMILSPKNLMEKMVVRCPNVGHCNEVLPRFNLEDHLKRRCRGGKRNKQDNNNNNNNNSNNNNDNIDNCDKQQCCGFVASQGNEGQVEGHVGESNQSFTNTTTSSNQSLTSTSTTSSKFIDLRDRISVLHIYKGQSSCLGISIVGGMDTPLPNIVVQEVLKNGAAYRDGRLTPGDHILEVNGIDLTSISHLDAVRALSRPCIVAQLTICKEGDISLLSKQETISVTLRKHDDNQLGIKLIQKKHLKGIFILEIIPGGIADWDGRLQSDDLILQVNGRDILEASQEEAVHIIKASPSQVTLLVSRIPSSLFPTSTPFRSSPVWCDDVSINSDDDAHLNFFDLQFMPRDKVIQVQKMEGEYLGLSIGGGLGSCSGKHNTPIYITNLWTGGCLAKTNQLMEKGRRSALGEPHQPPQHKLRFRCQSPRVGLEEVLRQRAHPPGKRNLGRKRKLHPLLEILARTAPILLPSSKCRVEEKQADRRPGVLPDRRVQNNGRSDAGHRQERPGEQLRPQTHRPQERRPRAVRERHFAGRRDPGRRRSTDDLDGPRADGPDDSFLARILRMKSTKRFPRNHNSSTLEFLELFIKLHINVTASEFRSSKYFCVFCMRPTCMQSTVLPYEQYIPVNF